jgi:hypothetical protein
LGEVENPTAIEKEGNYSRSVEEANIIRLYGDYVLSEFKNIKTLEGIGVTEGDPRIINLKNNIKDDTYIWVMTLAFVESTLNVFKSCYEGALENFYAYHYLNKNTGKMDSTVARLNEENLRKKEKAIKENLTHANELLSSFLDTFRAPMGTHKSWYDSLRRAALTYMQSDRSALLRDKFYPLMRVNCVNNAVKKGIEGVWLKTRDLSMEPVDQYQECFRPILEIAFSRTKPFAQLIPSLSDYQTQIPLSFEPVAEIDGRAIEEEFQEDYMQEPPQESVKEASQVSVQELPQVSVKESPLVSVPEAPKESVKESPPVSVPEASKESVKESPPVSVPEAP